MSLDVVQAAPLGDVPHGFFGRTGGMSSGDVASLNCGLGSGDDPGTVRANRRRAADFLLPGAPIAGVYQIHSAEVVTVHEPTEDGSRQRADALVTDRPGLLLAIVTADCAPVLLADREAGVVGAAHAGWRGALAGVTDRTIGAMIALGARPDRIAAAVGPCIGRASYEVGEDFAAQLISDDPANEHFLSEGASGRPHFDLEAYVAARIAAAGVRQVSACGLDTFALEERYFSYRRATLRGTAAYGRQISLIGLAPS